MVSKHISRRNAIQSTTSLLGISCGSGLLAAKENDHTAIGRKDFWEPGPDKNLVRSIVPGNTPIRLGGELGNTDEDFLKKLDYMQDRGVTAAVSGADLWNNLSDSQLHEYKDALKQHKIIMFEIAGYRNIITPDDTKRREQQKRIAYCLEAAAKVDCPMVGTITGSCDPKTVINVHPDNWTLGAWKRTVESIQQIFKDTAGMDVALGMEAQITTNLDCPMAHLRLLEDVGDPRCKVNLDPTNMISLKNYYHTTELINDCFDLLGENIVGCHAKDTYIWPDKQTLHIQELCAGQGVLDYETYLVRLSRMNWPRTLLPEHIKPEQYDDAYAYIRKVAKKVGIKIYGDEG